MAHCSITLAHNFDVVFTFVQSQIGFTHAHTNQYARIIIFVLHPMLGSIVRNILNFRSNINTAWKGSIVVNSTPDSAAHEILFSRFPDCIRSEWICLDLVCLMITFSGRVSQFIILKKKCIELATRTRSRHPFKLDFLNSLCF